MPWYRTMNWWFRLLASYLMPYPIIHIPSWQRNISPTRALLNTFESMISNFPFPQVGYGLVPWEGILFYLGGSFHPFQFLRWALAFLSLTVGSPIPAFRSTIPVAAVSVVPTPPPTNLPTTPQPQLFLGRLPADVTQEELEELLMPYGATMLGLVFRDAFFLWDFLGNEVMKRENMKVNSEVPEC